MHGYLLEGSGSNLWTRAIVEALCRQGQRVHLMAQENHPERYPFITEFRRYFRDGTETCEEFDTNPYPGSCVLHKPMLGDTLPVYVWDRYEEFSRVVPMIELNDAEIEQYLAWNASVLQRIVEAHGITAVHANHSVLMPQVAQRVQRSHGVPFTIMPHGSGIEFAVRRDARFQRMAEAAFSECRTIFVHGSEMRGRVSAALPGVHDLDARYLDLHLGVDTSQFEPVQPPERPAMIARLMEAIRPLPRGRTAEATAHMLEGLEAGMTCDALGAVLDRGRGHDHKTPDADVETRLGTVRWGRDPVLLYVGRLISTKGIQSVVAALPFLLRAQPDLRLVIVGHGPLREPLEAMILAMARGDADTIRLIAEQGRILENSPQGDTGGTALTQVALYLGRLDEEGRFDEYIAAGAAHVRADSVIFTGYLTHNELHLLFPCCDAAVFPSVVKEAGPLVFLEALASGVFPLGTYFGGMRESIDKLSDALPPDAIEAMKLTADAAGTVEDIVQKVPLALTLSRTHQRTLFEVARERYDWSSVAATFHREVEKIAH